MVGRREARTPERSSWRLRSATGGLATLLLATAVVGLGEVNDVAATTTTTTTTTTTIGSTTSTTSTTTTTPTTTTSVPVTTTLAPTVTLSAVGDSELGNTPHLPGNPNAYFNPVRAALAAPIVFGNLEGTFTDATTSKCNAKSTQCYAFRVPPSYARVYANAGFTVLNSANNHSDDFGAAGLASTTAALRGAGIAQAGLPGQIGLVRDGTLRVAFVDFAPYVLTNDMLNFSSARQLIRRAKSMANVVVVYMHAGAEGSGADHVTRSTEYFVGENRGNPFAFAHAAIDDGADLVIASGPHVLRGMEWYRGHLIDYSLGNFTNYDDFSSGGDLTLSGILRVTLGATGGFVSGRFTSVVLRLSGQAFVDPTRAAASFVNQLSRTDFGSNAAVIARDGAIVKRR
ncbi:MAG TPA: CapA family protein [Acidimicrobiales bacterium]|nr:CapA family protein [Acidimicrobiales bacterium]